MIDLKAAYIFAASGALLALLLDDKDSKSATVGRSPYNLHHANASRFKAVGELLLLEDHLINDPCPECMNKHSITASRLMSEAASLEDGQMSDIEYAEAIESIREKLKPENDIPLAAQTRDLRKRLQKSLNLSHGHVDGDSHKHA